MIIYFSDQLIERRFSRFQTQKSDLYVFTGIHGFGTQGYGSDFEKIRP